MQLLVKVQNRDIVDSKKNIVVYICILMYVISTFPLNHSCAVPVGGSYISYIDGAK